MRKRTAEAAATLLALLICALVGGCSSGLPRIDPSGEQFFLPNPEPIHVAPPVSTAPITAPTISTQPGAGRSILLHPAEAVAPVGSEVVMVASLCAQDGYSVSNQRIEWMLAPTGVGEFVAVGERAPIDWLLNLHTKPQKVDNTYAIGATSSQQMTITRGTPDPADDVAVLPGQAWVTITSPVEGTSNVTAFAPGAPNWDGRLRTSRIHWIDSQWSFPPPAVAPAGSRHVFTTTVMRQSDQSAVEGWLVRHEIVDGPPAGFAPDGEQVLETVTDAAGQARAEIFQQQTVAGSNTVRVEVIRPAAAAGAAGRRLAIGTGATQITWTAPEIALRKTGPATGAVGATLSYQITVENPGAVTVSNVVVADELNPALAYLASNPPAENDGRQLLWRLGTLAAGESRLIQVDFRAEQAGAVTNCATATADEGLTARNCITTTVGTADLEVSVTGPARAAVGEEATFEVTVTNRGAAAATGLILVDRFDDGLRHAAAPSPIERDLPDLESGESTRFSVTFRVTRPGELCNSVEVISGDSVRAEGRACLTATDAPAAVPSDEGPARPPFDESPAVPSGTVSVTTTGPGQRAAGETAEFAIEVQNAGRTPLTGVKVAVASDAVLEPTRATDGFQFAGDDLVWTVDRLEAGQAVRFQVNSRCNAPSARACTRVVVTTNEGARDDDEVCLGIVASAAQPPPRNSTPPPETPDVSQSDVELAVTDLRDPVALGNELLYEIRVTNRGAAADRNLTVTATLPREATPLDAGVTGPSVHELLGQQVRFAPVLVLQPGETLTYRITARAAEAGESVTLTVELTSDGLATPLTGGASSTIFGEP